eukprot:CAMPEP_0185751124 /NCGR_PEP_ID=MMETSP1174-20130828/9873_1 /TAXON_ID=35687 /ORGANISM="Dictyocha speculum, Strain CCMP1381" /LENGTH=432 /DNA_ID=CAMNT_0028427955 /DNA_START=35 /DNA_END=1334 /DNA_ORIENTATION=-
MELVAERAEFSDAGPSPMVDQSELPFRMLARKHGADLCYTPMIHARLFNERDDAYRARVFTTAPEDRPLFVQFCGHEPEVLLSAALRVQDRCDAVDLNLGCPQGIARKGRYGAFLLEEEELVLRIVRTLANKLDVPLSVKIRLLPDQERTIDYARRIVEAGASILCVHGRTRDMKQQQTSAADWSLIKRIKEAVRIPVIANGNIARPEDVDDCLNVTGVDAVMSSEMSLCFPDVFRRVEVPQLPPEAMVEEYLALVQRYPVHNAHKVVKAHLFKLLYPALRRHPDLRERLGQASHVDQIHAITRELSERGNGFTGFEDRWFTECWYFRYRTPLDGALNGEDSIPQTKARPAAASTAMGLAMDAAVAAATAKNGGLPLSKRMRNRAKRQAMRDERKKAKHGHHSNTGASSSASLASAEEESVTGMEKKLAKKV